MKMPVSTVHTSWRAAPAVFALAFALAGFGCEPSADEVLRPRPEQAFLRDMVVVGDAYAAGVQSGALTKRLQLDSVPAILATAFGTTTDPFEALIQPLVANPGYPVFTPFEAAGAYVIVDFDNAVRQRVAWPDTTLIDSEDLRRRTMELEFEVVTAFRNLAHPGCFAWDVLNARAQGETWTAVSGGEGNLFVETVLRPWRTDIPFFQDSLTVLQHARSRTPRLALVGLGFAELFHALSVGGGNVPYDAATFGDHLGAIVDSLMIDTEGRVVVFNRPSFRHLAIDEFGLDPAEVATLIAADDAYAAATADVAVSRGLPLVDVRGWFADVARDGVEVAGITLTLDRLGGIRTLDNLTPSSPVNAFIANEAIEAINSAFGTTVPPVDVWRYLDQSVITAFGLELRGDEG